MIESLDMTSRKSKRRTEGKKKISHHIETDEFPDEELSTPNTHEILGDASLLKAENLIMMEQKKKEVIKEESEVEGKIDSLKLMSSAMEEESIKGESMEESVQKTKSTSSTKDIDSQNSSETDVVPKSIENDLTKEEIIELSVETEIEEMEKELRAKELLLASLDKPVSREEIEWVLSATITVNDDQVENATKNESTNTPDDPVEKTKDEELEKEELCIIGTSSSSSPSKKKNIFSRTKLFFLRKIKNSKSDEENKLSQSSSFSRTRSNSTDEYVKEKSIKHFFSITSKSSGSSGANRSKSQSKCSRGSQNSYRDTSTSCWLFEWCISLPYKSINCSCPNFETYFNPIPIKCSAIAGRL